MVEAESVVGADFEARPLRTLIKPPRRSHMLVWTRLSLEAARWVAAPMARKVREPEAAVSAGAAIVTLRDGQLFGGRGVRLNWKSGRWGRGAGVRTD